MAQEIKQIVERSLKERLIKDIPDIEYAEFQKLKSAATTFLQNVDIVSDLYENGLKKRKIKDKIKAIYAGMRQESSFTQSILEQAHTFEKTVNEFLGRTIYLTYVRDDGSFSFYDDINIGKIYQEATANKGRGNISSGKMFDANDLQEDLQKALDISMRKKFNVYTTAVARWKSNSGEEKKEYDPSAKTFYWRLMDNHHISGHTAPIATQGIIAEGYAGAVINDDSGVSNSSLETSLQNLWLNHIAKDSIGGLVKGDIVLQNNGKIQFAVKQGSFSTAMIGQYVNLASNIQQMMYITPQELEAHLPKLVRLSKASDGIAQSLNESVIKKVDEIILSS